MKEETREIIDRICRGEFSLADYVKLIVPPPKEGEDGYEFYQQWGYDQWLIKETKQDLNSMKMLHRNKYNHLRMMSVIEVDEEGEIVVDSLVGMPIIRTKENIQQFPMNSIAKGWAGLELWNNEEGRFCIIQGTRGAVVRHFSKDEIEYTGETFENPEQFDSLSSTEYFPHTYSPVGKTVEIGGRVGEVEAKQKGMLSHNPYEARYLVRWEDTGKQEEVDANLNDIRRVK